MDYEKKYKEALERAKEIIECSKSDTKEVKMVLSFFPELKGNKDEQMRKKCIELIKELKTFCMRDGQEECIAWLEKQGEQKPADKIEPKFKVGDKVKSIIDGFECTIESIDNICFYGDTTNFDIQDQDEWELIEQNSAEWSEEDEEILNSIKYHLDCDNADIRCYGWIDEIKCRIINNK